MIYQSCLVFSWILQFCIFATSFSSEELAWAQGDSNKVQEYYALHEEGYLDRFLGYLASRLGVIIHGDINQKQLAELLNNFDIKKLLAEGPYPNSVLSIAAQQLIYDSLSHKERVMDIHLHNLGYDEGSYLNPKAGAYGIASWKDYFTFLVLRYASGMSSPIGSTQEARTRIHLYAEHFPKLYAIVLPIHEAVLEDGTIDWKNTGSSLANKSALLTALTYPESDSIVLPAISIHPFDTQWRDKLQSAHAKGIRLVKWMPPQGIQPDSDLIDEYYRTLKQLGMTLIAHAGQEHVIPTNEDNLKWAAWGNPLRFRKPLQLGVNVILAHSGHYSLLPDLDHPDQPHVQGYKLFLRLAKEAYQKNLSGEWTGKLYGDLSAVIAHYGPELIKELLLHANDAGVRLIYGSDYPHTNLIGPGNDAYILCAQAGLVDPTKVKPLQEIRNWNPLLGNYIFTENLELKTDDGQRFKFPPATFNGQFTDGELHLMDLKEWQRYKQKIKREQDLKNSYSLGLLDRYLFNNCSIS